MRSFLLLAVALMATGCSDPVKEYNEQRELLKTITADFDRESAALEAKMEPQVQELALKQLGFNDETISKEIRNPANDIEKINAKEKAMREFREKLHTIGTPENKKIRELAKSFKEYERIERLSNLYKSTTQKIEALEKRIN